MHDADTTLQGLIEVSQEICKAWSKFTAHIKKKINYKIIEDGMGIRVVVMDVDLTSLQVSKQTNAQEDDVDEDPDGEGDDGEGDDMDGATHLMMKGKKRANLGTKAAESNKPSILMFSFVPQRVTPMIPLQ